MKIRERSKNRRIPLEQRHIRTPISTSRPSLLQQLMDLVMEEGGFQVSFEDLTGICQSIDDLKLPGPYHWHTGELCRLAKYGVSGSFYEGCRTNKQAVNRVVSRKQQGFCGQCHLGLSEYVQPLVVDNVLLGIFYCGAVVAPGTLSQGRERIRAYCARKGVDPEPLLASFEKTPRANREGMNNIRKRAAMLAAATRRIVEASGMPVRQYKPAGAQWIMEEQRKQPAVVRRALWHISNSVNQPVTVQKIAERMSCHPDYLSRMFKASTGITLHEFIVRTRLDRAQRLLRNTSMDIGQIGMEAGFRNHSHFTKVFRLYLGITPREYRDSLDEDSV